jgi:CubicO group peptidase (beta-lactamase class C family)
MGFLSTPQPVLKPGKARLVALCVAGVKVRNGSLCVALLLGVLLTVVLGCGQEKTPKVRLRGDRFDPVRSLIDDTVRKHNIASVAIAAAKDGEVVWEEAFGWADKEKQTSATPHSIYALASISKSFTATGLMVLAERGLVDLDRPVNEYLGEAKLISYMSDSSQATVRQVLLHAAGLPMHHNIFFENEAAQPPAQDESIRRYGVIVDQPAREFVYSNFGYGVLDRVIARVSGRSYAEFMKTEVFAPLGLTHTSVLADSTLRGQTVRHYDPQGNLVPTLDFDHRGASAVYSSVHDLVHYGMFHLQNEVPGQKPIINERTIDTMHRPSAFTIPEQAADEVGIGLGWAVVDMEGVQFINISGGMPGTVTRLALIPTENAAVAITINSGIGETYSPWDIEWETFAALIPGFPEKPEIAAPKHEATPMPAEFQGDWIGRIRTYQGDLAARLSIRNGRNPVLEIDGKETRTIRAQNPLGGISFRQGVFQAPFFGSIPTDDCKRSRHVLFLRLRRRGDTLSGVVAAVAINRSFWLPHWVELARARDGSGDLVLLPDA